MKDGAGVAENQLLHRLFFTSSPCIAVFCKSLIISNNVPRTCVLAFQRLLPKKWCKMLLLVWFSVADYSLLLSAEKPQVPATVRGIKRKLPGTLFVSPWQSVSSGGGGGSRTRVPTRSNEDVYMLISSLLFIVLCRSR